VGLAVGPIGEAVVPGVVVAVAEGVGVIATTANVMVGKTPVGAVVCGVLSATGEAETQPMIEPISNRIQITRFITPTR
jgi:hypothetical protein